MPVKWVDKFVKCPFYRTSSPGRIVCEGVDKGNNINLTFEDRADKVKYMKEVCYDLLGCRDCPIYIMLEQKYEEDGDG